MNEPLHRTPVRPIRQGTAGHLRVTPDTAIPVHVAGGGEDILLVLLVNPGNLLDGAATNLTLESISSRGLVRMRGTAERIDSDLVRFHLEGQPEVLQRRQFVRVVAPQRVTVDDPEGASADTRAVNISGGGMLLSGPASLDLDSTIDFGIYLRDWQAPVLGSGRVVRTGSDGQRAVVFEEIAQADRERLIHFIFDRQRVALAVTRGDAV